MKRIKFVLALMLLVPILGFSIEGNTKKYDYLKGVKYSNLTEIKEFNAYEETLDASVFEYNGNKYYLHLYIKGNTYVYSLGKLIKENIETGEYTCALMDVLEIKGLGMRDGIHLFGADFPYSCRQNKKESKEILAVFDITKVKDTDDFMTNPIKAWEIVLKEESIKEVPTKGIDCIIERFEIQQDFNINID